ncbi:putative fibrillin-1 [Apostichopus japonicus]|uniref:Putative fibrillin-1 n=1 Tax=Stichopus japonicus TaxID=307972 RepID=A0A2G8LKD9_STIJA|nr:putative fibrillin-1 [Apostichopus japonicus]
MYSGLVTCGNHAICQNIIGSYFCSCEEGWEGDGTIVQISMNASDVLWLSPKSLFENTNGSFICTCPDGYIGDGVTCLDEDECMTGEANYSSGVSECLNTVGSYICRCLEGYEDVNGTCQDINECNLELDNCSQLCTNMIPGFRCECDNSFYLAEDGISCIDINECSNGILTCSNGTCVNETVSCDINGFCENTEGSYICMCNSGYIGTGQDCVDINECMDSVCDPAALCVDLEGNYSCSCPNGYTGDGYNTCDDVNECEDNTNECDVNANCTDLEGSILVCQMGYYSEEGGNGRNGTCKDAIVSHHVRYLCDIKGWQVSSFFDDLNQEVVKVSLAIDRHLGGHQNKIRLDLLNNSTYTLTDIEDAFMNGLTGRNNDFLEPDSRILRDNINTTMPIYDQCDEGTHDCFDLNFLECVFVSNNTFTCANCKAGYQQVGSICDDVDECQDDPCSYLGAAECINTIGSYICQCQNDTVIVDDVCTEYIKFRGKFTVLQFNDTPAIYTSDLNDTSSQKYQDYEATLLTVLDDTFTAYNQTSPYFVRNEILGFKSGSVVPYYISFFHPTAVNVTTDTLESALLSAVEGDKVYSSPRNLYVVLEVNTIEFEDFVETCPDAYCSNGGTCMVDFVYDKVCITKSCNISITRAVLRKMVRNLIAGVESEGVATSTDFSIDDDFSSFSDSYDEVDEVEEEEEEEDDANRRMEHLMDVIRNSPYINERCGLKCPVPYKHSYRMEVAASSVPGISHSSQEEFRFF